MIFVYDKNMRKILLLILSAFIITSSLFYPKQSTAQTIGGCNARAIDPIYPYNPANNTHKLIDLIIETPGLVDQDRFYVQVKRPNQNWAYTNASVVDGQVLADSIGPGTDTNGTFIRVNGLNSNLNLGIISAIGKTIPDAPTWSNGDYEVRVLREYEKIDTVVCTVPFKIEGTRSGPDGYCEIEIIRKEDNSFSFTENDEIRFRVNFLVPEGTENTGSDDTHRIIVKSKFGTRISGINSPIKTSDLIKPEGVSLGRSLSVGDYNIEVRQRSNDLEINDGKKCNTDTGSFWIRAEDEGGGGVGCSGNESCNAIKEGMLCMATSNGVSTCKDNIKRVASNPCDTRILAKQQEDYENAQLYRSNYDCITAFGTISTNPSSFIKSILVLILSLSGGILLLFLIINGYKLMTSQGDPEKIKEARESVISAIAGLLMIIFSITILQLITVDILGLPGFR